MNKHTFSGDIVTRDQGTVDYAGANLLDVNNGVLWVVWHSGEPQNPDEMLCFPLTQILRFTTTKDVA